MIMYSINNYEFRCADFFPMSIFDQITEMRVEAPDLVLTAAESRERRPTLTLDGKLVILAADHLARMVTSLGDDPIAMGDRQQYLGRVLRVISSPGIDGVMGTTEILEDLLILNALVKEAGGPGLLDGKLLIGCMNRTGLAGAAWEMDDRLSSWTAESMVAMRLDGAKVMFRLCLEEPELSNRTLSYCVQAINDCNRLGLPVFLEPIMVKHEGNKYVFQRNYVDLIKTVCVAYGMGDSSRYLWLKIPYGQNYELVARAVTCPLLMLGGESTGDPTGILEQFAAGMKAGNNVRGALVGRNITFPGRDDPLAVALAVNAVVHEAADVGQAVDVLMTKRDDNFDVLTRYLA